MRGMRGTPGRGRRISGTWHSVVWVVVVAVWVRWELSRPAVARTVRPVLHALVPQRLADAACSARFPSCALSAQCLWSTHVHLPLLLFSTMAGPHSLSVTSDAFEGVSRVSRHRKVYGLLADELSENVHALSITTQTPAEAARTSAQ